MAPCSGASNLYGVSSRCVRTPVLARTPSPRNVNVPPDSSEAADLEAGPTFPGATPGDAAPRAPTTDTDRRPLSILLAEDNPGDARLLQETLKGEPRLEATITRTASLAETVGQLRARHHDVLLLDLGLPDADGIESVQGVLDTDPTTAVVVLTGLEDEEIAERALQEGVQDYLVKGDSSGRELARAIRYAYERKAAELRERESRRLLRTVAEETTDLIFVKDRDGRYRFANSALLRYLGRPRPEVIGAADADLLPEETARSIREDDLSVMEAGTSTEYEESVSFPDGTERRFSTVKAPYRDHQDRVVGVFGIARDVTEQATAREALARAEEKFSTAFQVTPVAMAITTAEEGRIVEVNEAFTRIYGAGREAVLGRTATELGIWPNPADRERFRARLLETGEVQAHEVTLRDRAGEPRTMLLSGKLMELAGDPRLLISALDITDRKEFERALERRALYDELTGLPNRSLFQDRLQHALERASRNAQGVAVLFMDLDRFKIVNDSLGHAAGDQLLASVAERIRGCFREQDTVARLGGDEFGALLEQVGHCGVAETTAQRLVEVLDRPFQIAGSDVHAAVSIGIAYSGPELRNPEDLLRFSDVAMYRAKRESGTSVTVFDPTRDSEATERLQLENDLRSALERKEIGVHFQPIVALEDRSVVGVEALARWEHPERGTVTPGEFIPLAEETGLIVPLGRQVLDRALAQAAGLRERIGADLVLSVNLSGRQMQEPDLVEAVEETLSAHDLTPDALRIEITESVAIHNVEVVRQLRERGIRVAVDDLGTGYASLEYLTHLEVDLLKLDRTFVAGLGEDLRDEAVAEAVLLVADRLGLPVVAEGIETEEQLRRLRDLGCGYGQGFHCGRPGPSEEVARRIEEGAPC